MRFSTATDSQSRTLNDLFYRLSRLSLIFLVVSHLSFLTVVSRPASVLWLTRADYTLSGKRDFPSCPSRSSADTLGTRPWERTAEGCRLSLEVTSSLQSLRSLHAMRAMPALRTMHAMQPGRGVCNDAITSPIVSGPSSWVIGESWLVTDCRCTGGCNDDLGIGC